MNDLFFVCRSGATVGPHGQLWDPREQIGIPRSSLGDHEHKKDWSDHLKSCRNEPHTWEHLEIKGELWQSQVVSDHLEDSQRISVNPRKPLEIDRTPGSSENPSKLFANTQGVCSEVPR